MAGRGQRQALPSGHAARVRLSFDPLTSRAHYLTVSVDGRQAVSAPAPYDRLARARLGSGVRPAATPEPSVCRRLLRRLG